MSVPLERWGSYRGLDLRGVVTLSMFVGSENRSRVILSKWVHRIFEMDLMKSNKRSSNPTHFVDEKSLERAKFV